MRARSWPWLPRDAQLLAEVRDECRARGAEAEFYLADVTSEAQVEQLRRDVLGRFGKLTVLVNNAGINIRKPITAFSLSEWHQVLDTNLTSVFCFAVRSCRIWKRVVDG